MVVIAAASVLLGAAVGLQRRKARFRRLAGEYAQRSSHEYMIGQIVTQATHFGPSSMELRMQEAHYARGDYYADLKAKYARAADRPWLPVGRDPSPPAWPGGVPYYTPPGARPR